MTTMTIQDKLRALLPHWMEHNAEHAAEFRRWAELAGESGSDIRAAADQMEEANEALAAALEKLGGPAELSHPHERVGEE
jgi:ferric-dicitrate binding protein FerR (iron transport regulator)